MQGGLQWQAFEGIGQLRPEDVRKGREGGELDWLYTPSAADVGPGGSPEAQAQGLRQVLHVLA